MLILSRLERELLPLVVSAPEVRIFEFTGEAFLFASFILRLASLLLFPFLAVLVAAIEWPALRAADFHQFLRRPGVRYPASQAPALTLLLGGGSCVHLDVSHCLCSFGWTYAPRSLLRFLALLSLFFACSHTRTHTYTHAIKMNNLC